MTSKREFRTLEECLIESLQGAKEAQAYLKVVLEEYLKDRDMVPLLNSLRLLAMAKGGSLQLTKGSEPDQQNLDELLDEIPDLEWDAVLEALGNTFTAVTAEPTRSF